MAEAKTIEDISTKGQRVMKKLEDGKMLNSGWIVSFKADDLDRCEICGCTGPYWVKPLTWRWLWGHMICTADARCFDCILASKK